MSHPDTATLLVSCRDRTGLVAALSDFIYRNGGNILDADQHSEQESGLFFMRLVWDLKAFRKDKEETRRELESLAGPLGLDWRITYSGRTPKVAVFSGKTHHCLYDLLLCKQLGDLNGEIAMVISNHAETEDVARHFNVPFTYIPVSAGNRKEAEGAQLALLEALGIDLAVLARYMQVLSPDFVSKWRGRLINIHHSFLPAFTGAKPYHQAKAKGVKVIGATAHYVTEELDQGPIIEQDVARVSHRDEVEDLVRKGRELERQVLLRAVRLHLDQRVLISGNRTIVFS
jgi:formyltetrahydrofolate deformylase